jgi:hypothetical protein
VEHADDRHDVFVDGEGDRDAAAEADGAQPRPQVVAPRAALRKRSETLAMIDNRAGEARGDVRRRLADDECGAGDASMSAVPGAPVPADVTCPMAA